jgi:hypothetical protein
MRSAVTSSQSRRLAGIVVAVAAAVAWGGAAAAKGSTAPRDAALTVAQASSAPALQTQCGRARGPFHDKETIVLAADGSTYIPYGITVPGLAHPNYQDFTGADQAQIVASADYWCANTIRLQVAQDNLVGADGVGLSADFLDAIEAEVGLAESLGMVVVINAQTQDTGLELGPTHATQAFWHALTGVYGTDPQVAFDLFNEPRVKTATTAGTWKLWQQGGSSGGVSYLGMQDLSDAVRADGAKNLIWIEGPYSASTLEDVGSYPVTGGPLMYAIHHPAGAHNSTIWWQDFGYLVKNGIAPVVVGEWTNYASSTKSECWVDAPTAVPDFLTYLQNHGIGMTAWKLVEGVLAESSDLSDPTRIRDTPSWSCSDGLDEGAGHQIMSWYQRQNGGQG